jgi:hypothetical protein
MSVTIQVVLPEELAREVEAAAARLNIPAGEYVKESVERRLQESHRKTSTSFLDRFTGIIDTPETDLASRVDEILYGGDPHK